MFSLIDLDESVTFLVPERFVRCFYSPLLVETSVVVPFVTPGSLFLGLHKGDVIFDLSK